MADKLNYAECRKFLTGQKLPAAFIDLDAFDSNIEKIISMMKDSGKTLRVASKSIRCVWLLKRIFERGGGIVQGIMCYTVEEAEFLSDCGFDNLLVAYPTVQKSDMDSMARMALKGFDASLVVDSAEQVIKLGDAGNSDGVTLQAVIDIDMSFRPLGNNIHLGVRRSPVRNGRAAWRVAEAGLKNGGVSIVGIMGYEAQIAGLGDRNPFSPELNAVRKAIRILSKPDVAARRSETVNYLNKKGLELRIVNGGGTGSLDSTSADSAVTEVTAGSGFFCPHLFSYYSNLDLAPAAFFALQVVRKPAKGMVACHGGGYVATGEPGMDRLPVPFLPEGCELLKMEGAGEVQTPVVIKKGKLPAIGDPIIFRHAKAGELSEHFKEILLVRDKRIVGSAATYRGDGVCFI